MQLHVKKVPSKRGRQRYTRERRGAESGENEKNDCNHSTALDLSSVNSMHLCRSQEEEGSG